MVKMDNVGFRFEPNNRVRLRAGVDPSVYGDYACVGNEGWIADRRQDKFDLAEVLIKWDRDHWAYNGVPDCWTFEEHFELVEDTMPDKKELVQQAALDFVTKITEALGENESAQPAQTPAMDLTARMIEAGKALGMQEPDADDEYTQAVTAAHEMLGEADAFVVIGARQTDKGLDPFALAFARSHKSELAVQAHLAGAAARAHQDLVIQILANAVGDES